MWNYPFLMIGLVHACFLWGMSLESPTFLYLMSARLSTKASWCPKGLLTRLGGNETEIICWQINHDIIQFMIAVAMEFLWNYLSYKLFTPLVRSWKSIFKFLSAMFWSQRKSQNYLRHDTRQRYSSVHKNYSTVPFRAKYKLYKLLINILVLFQILFFWHLRCHYWSFIQAKNIG